VKERHRQVCRIVWTDLHDGVDDDDLSYDEDGERALVDYNAKGYPLPYGLARVLPCPVSVYRICWDEEFWGGGLGSGQCRFCDG
jgi:hypothetical protein